MVAYVIILGMSAKKRRKAGQTPQQSKSIGQRIQSWFQDRNLVLKFLLGFTGCMGAFYLFYYSGLYRNYLEAPFLNAQARLGNALLQLFGQDTVVNGSAIGSDAFSVNIKNGCDGLEATAILVSGILIFPVSLRKKLTGLAWGIPILFVANILRIAGLYLSGKHFSKAVFDVLHIQGGFILFTLLSVVLWFIWMNWATKATVKSTTA